MKEYVIWGIPPDKNLEELLHTKCESLQQAERAKLVLEAKYRCREVRIQEIDFNTPPDFAQVLNT